jgi:hypothetical protein
LRQRILVQAAPASGGTGVTKPPGPAGAGGCKGLGVSTGEGEEINGGDATVDPVGDGTSEVAAEAVVSA